MWKGRSELQAACRRAQPAAGRIVRRGCRSRRGGYTVSTADPGAHMLAGLLGVSEQSIQKARIAGLTIAPVTAGLFLAFAAVLLGHRRR